MLHLFEHADSHGNIDNSRVWQAVRGGYFRVRVVPAGNRNNGVDNLWLQVSFLSMESPTQTQERRSR